MSDGDDEFPLPPPPPRDLPEQLFSLEAVWPWWQGSPTELGRLASRLEARLKEHFMSFNEPRFEKALLEARRAGLPEPRQNFVFHSHSVTTSRWSGSVRTADLRDEIQARRAIVTIVHIQSSAIDRGWPVDVFDRVELRRPVAPIRTQPGVSSSWEVATTPQRVEITFQRAFPAVTLRVFAAGPQACRSLFNWIEPHLESGARRRVLDVEFVAALGFAVGLGIGDLLLTSGLLTSWWAALSLLLLGGVGWVAGRGLQSWAFPPLELLEAWERSRWSTLKTRAWEILTLALAVAGVVLAVVLVPK